MKYDENSIRLCDYLVKNGVRLVHLYCYLELSQPYDGKIFLLLLSLILLRFHLSHSPASYICAMICVDQDAQKNQANAKNNENKSCMHLEKFETIERKKIMLIFFSGKRIGFLCKRLKKNLIDKNEKILRDYWRKKLDRSDILQINMSEAEKAMFSFILTEKRTTIVRGVSIFGRDK